MVLILYGLFVLFECTWSLELLELRVPAHVPLGTRAALSCRWQLGPTDVLYSVKWYKDGNEFFRHVPRDVEPRRKFPLPGVDVEEFDSLGSEIVLAAASLQTSGRYRCEVSGERPLFPTVSDHADMLVVALPKYGPVLSGLSSEYRLGDRLFVNCTSGRSLPATRLSWYLNGEPLQGVPIHWTEKGLIITSMVLDFKVAENHFQKKILNIKCLATINPIYWRSIEKCALLNRNRTLEDRRNKTKVTRVDQVTYNSGLANASVTLIYLVIVINCI